MVVKQESPPPPSEPKQQCACKGYCRNWHAAGKCLGVAMLPSPMCSECRCSGGETERCKGARISGTRFCYAHQYLLLPTLHRIVRHWGESGLLEMLVPVDLEILLLPQHLQVLCGKPWLQFLAFRAKEPGPVSTLLQLAPAKCTARQLQQCLHQVIRTCSGSYDKSAGQVLHMGSRVLGFLNLMTACKMIVKIQQQPAQRSVKAGQGREAPRRARPPAASPRATGRARPSSNPRKAVEKGDAADSVLYAIGRDPAEQYELRDDDLSVLEAILAASKSHAAACETAQGMRRILEAFGAFLDELPSILKTGPFAAMARPHVMRKHLLVQNALHPGSADWSRLTWDDMNLAFPDVRGHLARDIVPLPLSTPARVAQQMHVPVQLMSMHLCLTHEALMALRYYTGQEDPVEYICFTKLDLLIQVRHEFRESNGHNPNAATLVRLAAAAAGLTRQTPAAHPEEASADPAQTAAAPPWKQLLRSHSGVGSRTDSTSIRKSQLHRTASSPTMAQGPSNPGGIAVTGNRRAIAIPPGRSSRPENKPPRVPVVPVPASNKTEENMRPSRFRIRGKASPAKVKLQQQRLKKSRQQQQLLGTMLS